MTELDNLLLKNIEKYEIENNDIPVLMRKYPYIATVAYNALKNNISLIQIENNLDYVYFVLGTLANSSIKDLTDLGQGYYFDTLEFFMKLEDYLIHIFDIKKVESALLSKRIRKRKDKILEYKLIKNICEKLDIPTGIFDLLQIRNHNTNIEFSNISKIVSYTNLLKKD